MVSADITKFHNDIYTIIQPTCPYNIKEDCSKTTELNSNIFFNNDRDPNSVKQLLESQLDLVPYVPQTDKFLKDYEIGY